MGFSLAFSLSQKLSVHEWSFLAFLEMTEGHLQSRPLRTEALFLPGELMPSSIKSVQVYLLYYSLLVSLAINLAPCYSALNLHLSVCWCFQKIKTSNWVLMVHMKTLLSIVILSSKTCMTLKLCVQIRVLEASDVRLSNFVLYEGQRCQNTKVKLFKFTLSKYMEQNEKMRNGYEKSRTRL